MIWINLSGCRSIPEIPKKCSIVGNDVLINGKTVVGELHSEICTTIERIRDTGLGFPQLVTIVDLDKEILGDRIKHLIIPVFGNTDRNHIDTSGGNFP